MRRWKNVPSWGASSNSNKGAEGRLTTSRARALFGSEEVRLGGIGAVGLRLAYCSKGHFSSVRCGHLLQVGLVAGLLTEVGVRLRGALNVISADRGLEKLDN